MDEKEKELKTMEVELKVSTIAMPWKELEPIFQAGCQAAEDEQAAALYENRGRLISW